MRLFLLAALAGSSLLTAGLTLTPADAQPGWHGRPHHAQNRPHRRCHTVWRHGHRVRRCR